MVGISLICRGLYCYSCAWRKTGGEGDESHLHSFCDDDTFLTRRCGSPSDEGFVSILKAFSFFYISPLPKEPARKIWGEEKNLGDEAARSIFFLFYLFIVPVTHNIGVEISLYVFAGCALCVSVICCDFYGVVWLVGSIDFVCFPFDFLLVLFIAIRTGFYVFYLISLAFWILSFPKCFHVYQYTSAFTFRFLSSQIWGRKYCISYFS